jgi:hypothetical protein
MIQKYFEKKGDIIEFDNMHKKSLCKRLQLRSELHSQSSIPSLNALGITPKFVEYIFQPKTPQFFTKKKNFLNCKSD